VKRAGIDGLITTAGAIRIEPRSSKAGKGLGSRSWRRNRRRASINQNRADSNIKVQVPFTTTAGRAYSPTGDAESSLFHGLAIAGAQDVYIASEAPWCGRSRKCP